MANTEKNISNISYTKKDFGSIYPEMIDLAKSLTNKWDPSTSNESDPGVVLLKEGAFVADHNNYNIDKNILEAFLPSATQDRSVRDIVETNGYIPRYYVSATGNVSITYNPTENEGEETEDVSFIIPAFTLTVSDADNTIAYTQISDIVILKKGIAATGTFIEGTIQQVTSNNSTTINTDNLDSNNRIYLPTAMVASNGIYIRYVNDADNDEYGYWTNNNYLTTQPNGSRIYKVDYDSYKGLPYIEFPSDISNIIGDGVTITYISTSGESGNVSSKTLVNIASPSSFEDRGGTTRNADDFVVSNAGSIVNGKDPETIDEMYKSFKKVVGTFDTLVTCKDYSNKIYTICEDTDYNVSNCYVADRRIEYNKAVNVITTDVNGKFFKNISIKPCTLNYKGVTNVSPKSEATEGNPWLLGNPGDMRTYISTTGEGTLYVNKSFTLTPSWVLANALNLNDFALLTEAMTPFDLTIYALRGFSISEYNSLEPNIALYKSFKPATNYSVSMIKSAIDSVKCISHTYNDPDSDDVFCFKNYCPIKARITPYTKVTRNERNEILNNVYIALSNNFNPRKVEFGTELDRDDIRKVIEAADERIKEVSVSDLEYHTSALFNDSEQTELDVYTGILPSSKTTNSTIITDVIAKNVLAGRVCLFDFDDDFTYRYGQKGIVEDIPGRGKVDLTVLNGVEKMSTELALTLTPNSTDSAVVDTSDATISKYTFTGTGEGEEGEDLTILNYIFNAPSFTDGKNLKNLTIGNSYTLQEGEYFTIKVTKVSGETGKEKTISVNTYKNHNNVNYTITNKLNYGLGNEDYPLINRDDGKYKPIEFNGSLVITEERYNTSGSNLTKNLEYTLKENEYIQIMNPNYYTTESYGVYVNYRYEDTQNRTIPANVEYTLGAGQKIIALYSKDGVLTPRTIGPNSIIRSTFQIKPTDTIKTGGVYKEWVDENGGYHDDEKFNTLSSNQTIDVRNTMTTLLEGTNVLCYWITNNKSENRLFKEGETKRILETGEYFVYTNTNFDEIMIMGSGTLLERANCDDESMWIIDSNDMTIEAISEEGTSANINWKALDLSKCKLSITEMTIVTLGEGDSIVITGWSWKETESNILNNTWRNCNGEITYTLSGESTTLPQIDDFYIIRSRLDFIANPENYQVIRGEETCKQTIVVTYKSSTGATLVDTLDKVGARIQASQYLNLIGNNDIDLSIYDGELSLYYYTPEKIVCKYEYVDSKGATPVVVLDEIDEGDDEYILNLNKKKSGTMVFPFYCNITDNRQYILPIFMNGVDTPLTAVVYDAFSYDKESKEITFGNEVALTEYNCSTTKYSPSGKGIILDQSCTFLLTLKDTQTASRQLFLALSWENASDKAELITINNLNIIKGISKSLEKSTDLNKVLNRIKEIVENSDNPSIKPYYIYKPENEMAIERPNFKEASTFWDKNNVANGLTIPQVEILIQKDDSNEFYIDIDKSMRDYEW